MPETQYITLYSYCGEDEGGAARYRVRLYEGLYEEHAEKDTERDGVPRVRYLSGFLFPRDAEYAEKYRNYGKIQLSVGRDRICVGDTTDDISPDLAAAHGHTVYRLEHAAQPPRFADGMLSKWCHFEGKTPRGM